MLLLCRNCRRTVTELPVSPAPVHSHGGTSRPLTGLTTAAASPRSVLVSGLKCAPSVLVSYIISYLWWDFESHCFHLLTFWPIDLWQVVDLLLFLLSIATIFSIQPFVMHDLFQILVTWPFDPHELLTHTTFGSILSGQWCFRQLS